MYPSNDPHLSANGNSPDRQSSSAAPCTTIEENRHSNAEDSKKEQKETRSEGRPSTTNSSTMTCPELPFLSWPPNMFPSPYPYNGGFYYPPPLPYYVNPQGYNIQFPGAPMYSSYPNNVNPTSSGISIGNLQYRATQSNTSTCTGTGSSKEQGSNSENMPHPNPNSFHPIPYALPTQYTPNNMWLSPIPLILSTGQLIQPNQSNLFDARSRNSLCSNCSREIIPIFEEHKDDNRPIHTPPNQTSFVDSEGRIWRFLGERPRKAGSSKGKKMSNSAHSADLRPSIHKSSNSTGCAIKKKVEKTALVFPSTEVPVSTIRRDNSSSINRKKKTKTRSHASHEDVGRGSLSRPPQLKPCLPKFIKTFNFQCIDSTGFPPISGSATSNKPPKQATSAGNLQASKKGEGQDIALKEPAKNSITVSDGELQNNEGHLNQSLDLEQPVSSLSLVVVKSHDIMKSPIENSTRCAASASAKYANRQEVGKTDELLEIRKSCSNLKNSGALRKDTTSNQCQKDPKEVEFWSSSSSSGTYDDSEAFDSYKLLKDIKEHRVNTEGALRQTRQHSRDRLFRRRMQNDTNAWSDEGLKPRCRSTSPKPKEEDDRVEEQIIIDNSQVRITEETPKRFVVESKDDSSSPKSMTITVQADVSRPNQHPSSDICEFCRSERQQVGAGTSCACNIPPCQRPEWQAPSCPSNEIHGVTVHNCHNTPANGRGSHQQNMFQRPRHANSPRYESNIGENSILGNIEEGRRTRRVALPNFGLLSPWSRLNADRPREENRHPHYIPPRPSSERFENIQRNQHMLPTYRRRWNTQDAPPHQSRTRQADEMLRIQIPSTFSRYRSYDHPRNHNENTVGNNNINDDVSDRNRNTIDINIFRGGVRRAGTNFRRMVRNGTLSSRSHENEEATPQDEDQDSNLDFYRRPRSAITVSKTNYFSPRNRKLEEEVQRIESANYGRNDPSTSADKEGEEGYPGKTCDDEQEFEDVEKPDCEYEEIELQLDQKRRQDIEDEED